MAFRAVLVLMSATLVVGQRPFFAGSKPIGYPEIVTTTTPSSGLDNKFGEGDDSTSSTTTQRLPLEALGDKDLVDRLSKLPIDKQPFWFLNWQALEAHRQNPQNYPQRPSQFIVGTQAGNTFPASGTVNSASSVQSVNSNSASGNFANGNVNSGSGILSNRNGGDDTSFPSPGPVKNSDWKKPNGSVTSELSDRNRVQSQTLGTNHVRPISGNIPSNTNKHNTHLHFSNGYGYF